MDQVSKEKLQSFINDARAKARNHNGQGSLEFEARFRGFNRESFSRLTKNLREMASNPDKKAWKPFKEEMSKSYIMRNGVRIIENSENKTVVAQQKTQLSDPIFDDNRLKYTITKETTLPEPPVDYQNSEMVRERDRTSFVVCEHVTIDATVVKSSRGTNYEIEVEITPEGVENQRIIDVFEKILNSISRHVPVDHSKDIINFFNDVITGGQKSSHKMIYGAVSRARDLTIVDFINGGLLNDYMVTQKTDGEYRFLVFHKSGIWMVFPSDTIERVGDILGKESLDGTILAGEVFDKDDAVNVTEEVFANRIFVPFDCLCFKRELMTGKNYQDRLDCFNKIQESYIELGEQKTLYIHKKKFHRLETTVDKFFDSMKPVFDDEPMFKTDGLIFTPINSGYFPRGGDRDVLPKDRILTKNPDICKWKPQEMLTIDLQYIDGGLYVVDDRSKARVKMPRDLSSRATFSRYNTYSENDVIEFKPVGLTADGKVRYQPERVRRDKTFPNKLSVIMGLVKLYLNPIRKTTLTGEDTLLMRKHHNKLKYNLFTDPNISDRTENILIDIGSGKGGDLSKWGKFSKVLAVEPNEENFNELVRRLKKLPKKERERIFPIRAFGEDSDSIVAAIVKYNILDHKMKPNTRVYISMMFCMGFFWFSHKALDGLTKTINKINDQIRKRGGERAMIIYITQDGFKLRKDLEKGPLNLNTILLEHNSDMSYRISIADSSTVSNSQVEGYVDLPLLFNNIGYSNVERYVPRDMFMSEGEKRYTSYLIMGIGKPISEPVEDAVPIRNGRVNTDSFIREYFSERELMGYEGEKQYVGIENGEKMFAVERFNHDDELVPVKFLSNNGREFFAVGIIDDGDSLIHSFLKLNDDRYYNGGPYTRLDLASRVKVSLQGNISIPDLFKLGNIPNIIVHHTSGRSPDLYRSKQVNRLYMFLLRYPDGHYEPLVERQRGGEYTTLFEKN